MADSPMDEMSTHPIQQLGLLTKTLIPSPVVKWILPARIRHRMLSDVVFVGEDFVEVKQVKKGGHFEHVISKRDFGSRICSAKVFTIDDPAAPNVDDILLRGTDYEDLPEDILPAQLLVLTLATPMIMFLYLTRASQGTIIWRQQEILLPRSIDALGHIGDHLSIDPQSRAMAVACRGGQIVLYSAKDRLAFQEELRSQSADWCPVVEEQMLRDNGTLGTLAHVTFLSPELNDRDHVILLLVTVDPRNRRTKLKWFDWRVSLGISKIQRHEPIPLEAAKCVPSMVIPLSNAVFLLVHQNRIDMWRRLLSGLPAITGTMDIDSHFEPVHPGSSPRFPIWSHWCRPMRSRSSLQESDTIYLCREDGLVFHLNIDRRGSTSSSVAGQLNCHAGEAFASLADEMEPDLLAIAADASSGRIVSIGSWQARDAESDRLESMTMKLVETLPNWTPVTDMVVARIPSRETRATQARDGIYVCSGRQPYGTITELRQGLEASMHTYFELPGLETMLDAWALLDPTTGCIVLLLSTPESTDVYRIYAGPMDPEIAQDNGVFDTSGRTLAAGTTRSHQLVQVMENKIIVAGNFDASFEDVQRRSLGSINTAVIEPRLDLVICCQSGIDKHSLHTYHCHPDNDMTEDLIHPGAQIVLEDTPLCMASAYSQGKAIVLIAFESRIQLYAGTHTGMSLLSTFSLSDGQQPCDQAALLIQDPSDDTLLAVCGLRDGQLATIRIDLAPALQISLPSLLSFGQSTVKLTRLASELDRAYAMCGTDTCVLAFDNAEPHSIRIERIWAADKQRPDLAQTQVFACTRFPPATLLSSDGNLQTYGDSFAMLSSSELWLTFLGHESKVVPRQLTVSGSPFRLIYAPAHHKLVCASLVTELNEQQTRRRCTPVIDFVSPSSGRTMSYRLEAGEQVYSLLEWAPENVEKDKSYQFILAGSRYLKHGTESDARGRISFLRRTKDGIESQFALNLDAPVFAVALYDSLTFAICYGQCVRLYRFSFDNTKFTPICEPILMASPASTITCEAPMLYVTTMGDSHLAIRVEEQQTPNAGDSYHLVVTSTGPRADVGVSHTVLSIDESPISLMTTSEREVIGLALPSALNTIHGHPGSAKIVFEGRLPQSVIRVRQCNVRPAWRRTPTSQVLVGNLIGCCTDGSIVGLSIIDERLWRRLSWLQRLVEQSPSLSSYRGTAFDAAPNGNAVERTVPIGLAGREDRLLATPYGAGVRARDMHIDGDILIKVLLHGGAAAIRRALQEAAQLRNQAGEWVREHLKEELSMADACAEELSVLLNSWL